jgi:lysozyme family protein
MFTPPPPYDVSLVRLIQRGLESLNLYTGLVDGTWGPLSNTGASIAQEWDRYAVADTITLLLSGDQIGDRDAFLKIWSNNKGRYDSVSSSTGVPSDLIAAIHYREAGGNFGTYLHNGDPLGRPTTHVPKGILFDAWEPAAIDALNRETSAFLISSIEAHPQVLAAKLSYAETYNGRGYYTRSQPSPYVWAGTTFYTSGKFTDDGKYSAGTVDEQIGVLPLLRACTPVV